MSVFNRRKMENYSKSNFCSRRTIFCLLYGMLSVIIISLFLFGDLDGENVGLTSKFKRSVCQDKKCIEDEDFQAISCPDSIDEDSICLSKDCTLTAATLITVMDTTVDPCDDFYKFSCANFIRKNLVPEEKESLTTFRQYQDRYFLQQKDLVENYNPYGEPDVVFRLQETYHVCINRTLNKDKELSAFKSFIRRDLDGWPMAMGKKWKPRRKRLEDYLANLYLVNIEENLLINIQLHEELDKTSNTIKEYVSVNLIPHQDLKNFEKLDLFHIGGESKKVQSKRNLLLGLLKLLGEANEDDINKEMEDILEMLRFLINVSKNDSISSLMTIGELNAFTNNTVDWLKLINAKFQGLRVFDVSDTVKAGSLLLHLPQILNKLPRRTLVNAVTLKIINDHFLKTGPPDVQKLYEEYGSQSEMIKLPPQWEYCLKWVNLLYPLVLTRMFIKTYVDKNSKTVVDEMIQMVQKSYKKQLVENKWLDEQTKEKAIIKANAIRRYVGYPEFIFDDAALEEEYKFTRTVRSTHFANDIEMSLAFFRKIKKTKREKWIVPPLDINAYYSAQGNSIWFPAGILQLPFYGENRLAAVNFGMIGTIIGHEIGHAFDNSGSRYNEKGELKSWWTQDTRISYHQRANCFVDQYNNFCPGELKGGDNDTKICVDGSYTLGENMADNTGLKAAYDAYQLWITKYGKEQSLPGLDEYSPEQLFFISAAYIYCENVPADKWSLIYSADNHAAGQYRVLGQMSNNEDFRKIFNCPLGKMNRGSESCVLW